MAESRGISGKKKVNYLFQYLKKDGSSDGYIQYIQIPKYCPQNLGIDDQCVLKWKNKDWKARLIYVGQSKDCSMFKQLLDSGELLESGEPPYIEVERVIMANTDLQIVKEGHEQLDKMNEIRKNKRRSTSNTNINGRPAKTPRTSGQASEEEDEEDNSEEEGEAEESHLEISEGLLEIAQHQLDETKAEHKLKKSEMENETTIFNDAFKANQAVNSLEVALRSEKEACETQISCYQVLNDNDKLSERKNRLDYVTQLLNKIPGEKMTEQLLSELKDKQVDATAAYGRVGKLLHLHTEAVEKLKLRVETAMKLDDQKKAIAKQEKDEFKAMKEDMENVKKQEEAIMGVMKDETPRRTMLPSRLPADEEKSETASSSTPSRNGTPGQVECRQVSTSPTSSRSRLSVTPSNGLTTSQASISPSLTISTSTTPTNPSLTLSTSTTPSNESPIFSMGADSKILDSSLVQLGIYNQNAAHNRP